MFIRWEGTQEMRTESSTNVDVIAVEALIEADGSYVRDVRQLGESGERENMLKQEPVDRSRPSKMFLQRVALLSQSSSDSFVVTPTTPRSQEAETKSWNNSWKIQADQSAAQLLSAIYGIVILILGLAFPLSWIISAKIPQHYYEGFYIFLFVVAIAFLSIIYISQNNQLTLNCGCKRFFWKAVSGDIELDLTNDHPVKIDSATLNPITKSADPSTQKHRGSFYLRIGAVVFGVGGMIYSGLDFAQYLEIDRSCRDTLAMVVPASQMIFTFLQMYFIFLNAKMVKFKLRKPALAHFGLMHMMATNMCLWLNAIIEETKHEIHLVEQFGDVFSHGNPVDHDGTEHDGQVMAPLASVSRDYASNSSSSDTLCRGMRLISQLVEDASPFLFPCTIEYSLICAATIFEILLEHQPGGEIVDEEHCASQQSDVESVATPPRSSFHSAIRSPHHYSVDCTRANKGLFFGIFILVLTIISMILFFVLISRDDFKTAAITEVHSAELFLYSMAMMAVIIGMIQMRKLRFDASRSMNLDFILIVVAQCGNISYCIFTIIGSQFSDHPDKLLVLMTSLSALVQGITQTIFILDASKRRLYTRVQQTNKPGRETVTFLLVTNFAMWALTSMDKSRADAHPLQSQFYGVWQWAIITNISTPLAIFYRFHSTVCLCEIWKQCYKVRDDLSH